jgi:hypothetical protein
VHPPRRRRNLHANRSATFSIRQDVSLKRLSCLCALAVQAELRQTVMEPASARVRSGMGLSG